eukprot:3255872-Rhodomonas_salina.2
MRSKGQPHRRKGGEDGVKAVATLVPVSPAVYPRVREDILPNFQMRHDNHQLPKNRHQTRADS